MSHAWFSARSSKAGRRLEIDGSTRRYYDTRHCNAWITPMADVTTMTSKGQVTVPREIRDRLGLKPGDKMAFTMLSDGTVVMRPKTRRLADLAGSLTRSGQPTVSVE